MQEARRQPPQVDMQLDLRAPTRSMPAAKTAHHSPKKVWELILRLRLSARLEEEGKAREATSQSEPRRNRDFPLFIVELEYGGVLAPT